MKKWIGIVAVIAVITVVIVVYVTLGAIEHQRALDECRKFAPSVGLDPARCR